MSTVTLKGAVANRDDDSGTDLCILSSVAIANGASVVVCVSTEAAGIASVTWNGQALTADVSLGLSLGKPTTAIYSKHNVTGATGDVVMTPSGTDWLGLGMSLTVYEVPGLASTPLDKSVGNQGTGTSPGSGATATTAQADEVLIGVVGEQTLGFAVGGTWDNSFIGSQDAHTAGIDTGDVGISSAYRIVAATGAYSASKSSAVNGNYSAAIATYKILSDVTTTKTQAGVARVTATTTKTQAGKGRVTATTTKTQGGLARITATTQHTQDGLARLTVTTTKTQAGVARVCRTIDAVIDGTARIAGQSTQTQQGVARIVGPDQIRLSRDGPPETLYRREQA